MNFTTTTINSADSPLYEQFRALYESSFPIFEQRSEEQQCAAFSDPAYRLTIYELGGEFVGFVAWWDFESYVYIEHFAINTEIRSKGYGSAVLNSFIAERSAIVLLEIDPIVDAISEARLRFYTLKCGFVTNPFAHTHPPYKDGCSAHQLVVMTTERELTEAEYGRFCEDLENVVMKF